MKPNQHKIGLTLRIRFQWLMPVLLILLWSSATGALAIQPLTADELISTTVLKAHQHALGNGEIVLLERPEQESDTELIVLMAMWVPAYLDVTIKELQRQSHAEDWPDVLDVQEITHTNASPALMEQFDGITFHSSEHKEVATLMRIGPGKAYNLSTSEIGLFNQTAKQMAKEATDSQAMTAAMRSVMQARYLSYLQKGLDGIPPYQIGPEQLARPAAELTTATESLKLIKQRFPAYYGVLRHFPQKSAPQVTHQFFWVKQVESSRPMFVLKHWVMDIRPEYGLIAERQYYFSHSLNSLQVVIGCLPYGKGTLVVLLNQVFTEKVHVTVGKRIAKRVGRSIMEKKVRPIFENLRAALTHEP